MKVRRIDWYHDDWLAGTGRLNAIEIAVYITVINLIYSEGGSIERDDRDLARRLRLRTPLVARTVDELKAKRKLAEADTKLYCRRCEDELNRARKRHESASKNAATRWEINSLKDAGASSSKDAHARDNHQPSISSHQSAQEKRAQNALVDEQFERWWIEYPEKVGKKVARQKFGIAIKKQSLGDLTAAVERYKANKPADRAWLNPATWLHQERWLDVPAVNGSAVDPPGWRPEFSFNVGPTEPAPPLEGSEVPLGRPH
jgi:uncharacterized protein YdaU (DUF1376 family)